MPRNPLAAARIPQEWMDQLQAICEATGKTQSEIVKDAIAEYLGQVQVNPVIPPDERLLALENKIDDLIRLTRLTQGEPQNKVDPSISPIQQRLTELTLEDMEDEPDEILTDFLESQPAASPPQ